MQFPHGRGGKRTAVITLANKVSKSDPFNYCKGIYTGCCIGGCQSPCPPCDRIKKTHHKKTCEYLYRYSCECGALQAAIEKEMVRKDQA